MLTKAKTVVNIAVDQLFATFVMRVANKVVYMLLASSVCCWHFVYELLYVTPTKLYNTELTGLLCLTSSSGLVGRVSVNGLKQKWNNIS